MIISLFLKKILGDFFTSWVVKGGLILAALLVISLTGKWTLDSFHNAREAKRQTTIGVLQNTNKDLKDTVDRTVKSQGINDKVVTQAIEDKEKLKEKTSVAKVRKEAKINTIETKYTAKIDKAKSKTMDQEAKTKVIASLEKEKAIEISTAHLEHLWSAYCDSTSQGSACLSGANV